MLTGLQLCTKDWGAERMVPIQSSTWSKQWMESLVGSLGVETAASASESATVGDRARCDPVLHWQLPRLMRSTMSKCLARPQRRLLGDLRPPMRPSAWFVARTARQHHHARYADRGSTVSAQRRYARNTMLHARAEAIEMCIVRSVLWVWLRTESTVYQKHNHISLL